MKKKILITGFKPFLGESLNPSEMLLPEIQNSDPEVATLLLPVSYQQAFLNLKNYWIQQGPFDALLMLGQAGGRKSICLERIAVNWSETAHPDEDGLQLPTGKIIPHAVNSYISDFFPTEWKTRLSQVAPVEISHSAGTFVCNSLYFQALHELPKSTAVLFTHLPYLPEQLHGKTEPIPAMSLALQLKVVLELIGLMKTI